jgi:hypothetical protein
MHSCYTCTSLIFFLCISAAACGVSLPIRLHNGSGKYIAGCGGGGGWCGGCERSRDTGGLWLAGGLGAPVANSGVSVGAGFGGVHIGGSGWRWWLWRWRQRWLRRWLMPIECSRFVLLVLHVHIGDVRNAWKFPAIVI